MRGVLLGYRDAGDVHAIVFVRTRADARVLRSVVEAGEGPAGWAPKLPGPPEEAGVAKAANAGLWQAMQPSVLVVMLCSRAAQCCAVFHPARAMPRPAYVSRLVLAEFRHCHCRLTDRACPALHGRADPQLSFLQAHLLMGHGSGSDGMDVAEQRAACKSFAAQGGWAGGRAGRRRYW